MCGGGRRDFSKIKEAGQPLIHIARSFEAEIIGGNTVNLLPSSSLVKGGDFLAALAWSKRYQTRVLVPLVWGIQIMDRNLTINARDDRLFESRTWREMMNKGQRCLILFSSFLEKGRDFALPDNQFLTLAGIYHAGRAAIITTAPNEDVAEVHHRMPAIITNSVSMRNWLNPACDPHLAQGLLQPYPGRLTVSAA